MGYSAEAVRLLRLAAAARTAIREGVDPALALSYVVWPTDAIRQASK